jgi:hypothetical protein
MDLLRLCLPVVCLLLSGCAVLGSAIDAIASANTGTSRSSPAPLSPVGLRAVHAAFCEAAADDGRANFCQLQRVLHLADGRALVVGGFRGQVRVGEHLLRAPDMESALAYLISVDGAVLWVRADGTTLHNRLSNAVQLADGRFAVAGVAAAGFHPSLPSSDAPRNYPMDFYGTERPFVGALTATGEWSWLRDWNAPILGLRAEDDGGFSMLDAGALTKLGVDAAIASTSPLPVLPPNAITAGARLGPGACAWQLFSHAPAGSLRHVTRLTCGADSRDWDLGPAVSTNEILLATSADGASLYVVAARYTSPPGARGSPRNAQLTMWHVDARAGVRFQTPLWAEAPPGPAENTAQPLALMPGTDGADVMLRYWRQTSFAGHTFPEPQVALADGRRLAGVIERVSASDGTTTAWFSPGAGDSLHYALANGLLSAGGSAARLDSAHWLYTGAVRCDGCAQDRVAVMLLKAQ